MEDVEQQLTQNNALVMVHLRNAFYRKKYYLMLGVYLLSLSVISIIVGMLVYLHKHPQPPFYFAVDTVGRLVPFLPLDQPNMPMPEMVDWVKEAVENAYSYDFVNYRSELQNAQKYFTSTAWKRYMDGLRVSNNIVALTQRKMVVVAKVVGRIKLVKQGILGGAMAWRFQLPLLVTYRIPPYDDKSQFQNPILVTMIVQRQDILTSYKGLGIMQLIGQLAVAPVPQNAILPAV